MRRARFRVAPIVNPAARASKKAAETSLDDNTVPAKEEAKSVEVISAASEPVVTESQITVIPPKLPSTAPADIQTPEAGSTPGKSTPLLAAAISSPPLSSISPDRNRSQDVRTTQHLSRSESGDGVNTQLSRAPLSPVKSTTSQEVCDLEREVKIAKARKSKREKTALDIKKEALKRKLAKGDVDRSQLTMFDLIYYNPVEQDKPPRVQEKLQMRLKPYQAAALAVEKSKENSFDGTDIVEERLAEEEEMIRLETGGGDDDENSEAKKHVIKEPEEDDEEEEDAMPVPQVRLGPDGEIILDDKSLVIETTEAKRNKSMLQNTPVFIENSTTLVNYGSWAKRPRSARWSLKETARFYKALAMLGTNFSMMEKLFPRRPRVELKRKFKLEEKNNHLLVDKILAKQIPFDPSQFLDKDGVSDSEGEPSKETTKKSRKRKGRVEEERSEDRPNVELEDSVSSVKPKRKRNYKSRSLVDSDSSEVNDVFEGETQSSSGDRVRNLSSLLEDDEIALTIEPKCTAEREEQGETLQASEELAVTIPAETERVQIVETSIEPAVVVPPEAGEMQVNDDGVRPEESETTREEDGARPEEGKVDRETEEKGASHEGEMNVNPKDDSTQCGETSNLPKPRARIRGRVKPNISRITRKLDEPKANDPS